MEGRAAVVFSSQEVFIMLAKRIIPCLDVNGGRVVKGVNFVNLVDAGDPVEIARAYNEQMSWFFSILPPPVTTVPP